MIRARFRVHGDERPVEWPVKHPYWLTGYGNDAGDGYAIMVAYADDEAEIMRLWPNASNIDTEDTTAYKFTTRFYQPDWWVAQQQGQQPVQPNYTMEEAEDMSGIVPPKEQP